MKRLDRKFFERPTVKVARELIGKLLVRKMGRKILKVRITETEAYCGIGDLACHASKGLTERTKVMFGPAGFSYVYMIYGMYHCLNIVTEKEGNPAAVLIRGAEVSSIKYQVLRKTKNKSQSLIHNTKYLILLNGPGKLCRELKIDKALNNVDVTKSDLLWIEDSEVEIKKSQIKKDKRIGVDYAGKWKDKLWHFSL
ncbi:MAG: DNA-3-methyladenine glycosylase [Patescibacteria group bacterium]